MCWGRELFLYILATCLCISTLDAQPGAELPSGAPAESTVPSSAPPKSPVQISVDGLFAVGAANQEPERLRSLQGGGHDAKSTGFNLQAIELSLIGDVDSYLRAELHTVFGMNAATQESFFHLEEAFFEAPALGAGFSAKGGHFLSPFGRINTQHAHAWTYLDQPVIASRVLGFHGVSGLGLQAAWLAPTPIYWKFIASGQNSLGEAMLSFGGIEGDTPSPRPYQRKDINGLDRLVFGLRNELGGDLSESVSSLAGLSFLTGPNALGEGTFTQIYGMDLTLKWQPLWAKRAWPFVTFQAEAMLRNYHVDPVISDLNPTSTLDDIYVPGGTLSDYGAYAQLLWGFYRRWSMGLRLDMASGNDDDLSLALFDPRRDDRLRVSPLLTFQPTEFARLRAQYNLDRATHLETLYAHGFWLGIEFMFGEHPAHDY